MKDTRFGRAKIVCTIGPASERPEMLMAMSDAGMDIARVNLSHGDRISQKRLFDSLSEVRGISTLIDLPGPKIRLGPVDGKLDAKR